MPACGEPALDDEARFCVGCGSALDTTPAARPAPAPPAAPSSPRLSERVFLDTPPPARVLPPKSPAETPPLVPRWLVVAGVVGLIALLVVLLLSR